jgi:hypothetical protein
MSTHLKAPPSPQPDDAEETATKKVIDLSLTQIVGGALAAMTAAALGSTLGVAGTIAGAALASVIAGVAGSLYTASLRTGGEKVRTVFRGPTDAATAPPVPVAPATTVIAGRAVEDTQVLPEWDPLPLEKAAKAATHGRSREKVSVPWRRAVAVSLSVFALAAVLITGYERVSGASLSGGTGTTVSEVARGSSNTTPESKPSSATSSTSTPSSEPSSTAPSAGTSVSSEPSASASDSTAPSAASTPAASDTPAAAASTGAAG